MSDLLIRDLDPDVHRELKRRADEEGMSLQAYVSRLLSRHVARPSMREWLRRIEQLPRHPDLSGADLVRDARGDDL
jgi:plasmid stability protein